MEDKYVDLLLDLINRYSNKAKPLYHLVLGYLSEDIAKEGNIQPKLNIKDMENTYCDEYRQRVIDAVRRIQAEWRLRQICVISNKMLEFEQDKRC